MPDRNEKADELTAAIAGLEAQRPLLGDAVVDPAITALRQQLQQLTTVGAAGGEERKLVTILFVDVSGFTALAEKLDPEDVRDVINACFDQLVPVVQKYGGTIDKFIGDEIMALFGAPRAHENDPERALRSALEMMTEISSFNAERGTTLSLHIGVNTGPVVTGAIGSHDRRDYSVMGDAVNLAARLEGAAADGEIYVGPGTFRLTEAIFDFEPLPLLTLKGKAEPLAVYRLVGLKRNPRPARGIEGLHSELIGRSTELEQINKAVRHLGVGTGGIVSVVGETGVGKSRLISEAFSFLAPDVCRAEGRALSHTAGMSYWMARDVLCALLGSSQEVPAEELRLRLGRALRELGQELFAETYSYLATLLQLPLEEEMLERVRFLSSEALQGRILQAFKQYVAACARRRRLIVSWEDLHWCDPSSLLALESLLPLTVQVPLLLILAYRPEEATAEATEVKARALGDDKFRLIRLSPLSPEESRSLVESLLKIENLPTTIRQSIVERADGNPFFIEELLRSLLDSGSVVVQDGRVLATNEIDKAHIPETMEGVIVARMDRLPAEDKSALQSAAVIGRSFQLQVLRDITPVEERESLDSCLSELRRREFIRLVPNGHGANGDHSFKHAITQDVAYNALLKTHRKEIHKKVGEAYEALFPNRLTELSATLAYHFERADTPAKAFYYSRQAGDRAQAIFANAEATAFYRSAITQGEALLEKNDQQETIDSIARVHESLGDVLRLAGRNEEARASYTASLNLQPDRARVTRSRLQRKLGSTYTLQRRYEAMTAAFDAAEMELGELPAGPPAEWWNEKMQVLLERMHLLYWQGMSDQMMELAERYRTDIEEKGTAIQRGKFFQMLGLSHMTRARYVASDEAVRLAELAVSTSRGSTDLSETSHVRFVAGLTHLFRGNLSEAIGHCEAALSLAERVGDFVVQARCLTYLTVAHRRSGHNDATRVCAYRAAALATQLGMVEYVAMAKANLAWLAWREGYLEDAESLGQEALRLWHEMEDPYGVDWQALLPLISVALAKGRFEDAVKWTRGLFGENQHPLPPELAATAQHAITMADKEESSAVKLKLNELVAVAKQIGYL